MASQTQQPGGPPLPPVPASPPSSGGVRRHHTITAASRSARAGVREIISEENPQDGSWNDDEVLDQDWTVQHALGAVGEKSSLHRQASLPTRYHRAFQGKGTRTGTSTPKTMNSLSAIAGHEGDEEDWERDMRGLTVNDDEHPEAAQHQQVMESSASNPSNPSPLSPHFNHQNSHVPSPPPAGAAGVRRHVSLTYGAGVGGPRKLGGSQLKRAGTLQTPHPHGVTPTQQGTGSGHGSSPSPTNAEEEEYSFDPYEYADENTAAAGYEEEYYPQGQYPTSPLGRSPWNNQGTGEWRAPGSSGYSPNGGVDDVAHALSSMELNPQGYAANTTNTGASYQPGQSAHPPRFNSQHQQAVNQSGARGNINNGNGNGNENGARNGGKLQLVTSMDGRKTPQGQAGPVSASAYMPPIGGSIQQQYTGGSSVSGRGGDDRAQGTGERSLSGRSSNPNLGYGYQQGQNKSGDPSIPNVPPIPQQYLQQQRGYNAQAMGGGQGAMGGSPAMGMGPGFIGSPIDVPTLIATKGYNPANFDVRPPFARFFVIKSYTEDDVHKSLKYEIWSSTDPGNKRLDKAFKECAGRGPIYLFFSVNASGHFCGMAEMLTSVDYTRSSTVWASDKWKGVFKVRWIFVRDIPNVNLRHIKLKYARYHHTHAHLSNPSESNTQERKPVTNSRDTQELLPEAGQEMLRIFHTHPARTSLLQDFAFYEVLQHHTSLKLLLILHPEYQLQAMQKLQQPAGSASPPMQSPQMQSLSPAASPQPPQNAGMYAMQNPNALAYQMPQMSPMMQMQMMGMNMGMGMGAGGSAFGVPQAQAMHQSVMRHASPDPNQGGGQQNFMGF
ncbi:hypothetical protein HGRIS_012775 [Hohenbuehelia grisea]|uniref:YTH domain-containing protein n=1 Tax=Hohenbuehelia grisea TaxID=104357 RepID=A0ABR3ITE3_9AGAR